MAIIRYCIVLLTDEAGVFPKPENIGDYVRSHIYCLEYPNYVPDIYTYKQKDECTGGSK